MQSISQPLKLDQLNNLATQTFGSLVKAVVDVERKILVIDAELHSDLEHYLLDQGSNQADLWGINLHPALFGTPDFIEYDSMINLRPSRGNSSRGVDDPNIRQTIQDIVLPLIQT